MTDIRAQRKDLILLVADKNMKFALRGVMNRPKALKIRQITFDIFPYIGKNDPGCFQNSHNFLRPHVGKYDYAMVLFDYDGSGQEKRDVRAIEEEVRNRLFQSGWESRAEVVVIKPELDIWVWSDSPEVSRCLGWSGEHNDLRSHLIKKNLWEKDKPKPANPKKALEEILRKVRKPRSSKVYLDLAKTISFQRCQDPAFSRLCAILRNWFSFASP